MDITVWIIGITIVVFGLASIGLLLKVILTPESSLDFDLEEDRRRGRAKEFRRRDSLELEVVHFAKETAGWTNEADRQRSSKDLSELRERVRRK